MSKKKKEEAIKPLRKIAMCGTAPSTRNLIPWDTDWEIWGQADCTHDAKNPNRWFDIAPYPRIVKEFPDYHKWLTKQKFPIHMRQHFPEVPTSVPFPFDEVGNRYGIEFMTATVTWMMGMAFMEHEDGDEVGVIGLFGYDMALDSEYAFQRPGIKHMEWVARQMGIEVVVPNGSDLAIPIIPYPFADDNVEVAKTRARQKDIDRKVGFLKQEKAKLTTQLRQVEDNLIYLDGATEDNNYHLRQKIGHENPAH